jgi:hypothetical protein
MFSFSFTNVSNGFLSLNIVYATSKDALNKSSYQISKISDNDFNQMVGPARDYVKANSVSGITFELESLKIINNCAVLISKPTGAWANRTDNVWVILEKVGGKWVPQTMGTNFSGSKWEPIMKVIINER